MGIKGGGTGKARSASQHLLHPPSFSFTLVSVQAKADMNNAHYGTTLEGARD